MIKPAELQTTQVTSPIGSMRIQQHKQHIVSMGFETQSHREAQPHRQAQPPTTALLREAATQLQEYFAGKRYAFRLPLMPSGTRFYQKAWQALQQIPYGKTASYQQQAETLGSGKLARAVGRANACNPVPLVVPCHRVIGKSGHLTGYACGLHRKQYLLQLEADTLKALDFLPLQQQHLALMHTWLNTPHVNTWWENRPWSVQEIADKYGSQIHKNTGVDGFIIQIHKLPVGFIQRYIMPNHLPEVSDAQLKKLQKQMGASDGVGLDMFIGDANWVGKGLGPVVLHQFLQRHVWPKWHVAVADPHHSNTRALSAYTKAGFHSLNHQQVTSSTYKPLPMRAIRPTA